MRQYDLKRLRQGIRPFRLHWFPRLRSTNDHAISLRRQHRLFAPAIVLTGCQTAGRGRGANRWWSAPGAITVTFALPVEEHLASHQVALAAGLAARNALAQVTGIQDIKLKWPNDLILNGLKIGGVLCERVAGLDLIGIGINLNNEINRAPPSLRGNIFSLAMAAGRQIDATEALIALARSIRAVAARRRNAPFPAVVREYEQHHLLTGRSVTCLSNGVTITGLCRGIDHAGRLIIQTTRDKQAIVSGTVTWP